MATTTICPNCGIAYNVRESESGRISELEAQVRLLTEKATDAVDKLADYEDELRRLKKAPQPAEGAVGTSLPTPPATEQPPPTTANGAFQSRFGGLLGSRKPSPVAGATSESPDTSKRESDLQAALAREQHARQKAEVKVTEMSGELEDLSVQLFQQANEMVANERKARAKLEERVEILEKRDVEKRKRLERLEGALKRIDRVRGLLSP